MHNAGYNRDRIRGELLVRGSSLAAIARELGLGYRTVHNCVSGMRSRRIEAKIAQVLEVSPEVIWPERYPEAKVR